MTEQLYPNLQGLKDPAQLTLQSTADSQLNYMMDKHKALKEKNYCVTPRLKITGLLRIQY